MAFDGRQARLALLLFTSWSEIPDAVLLVRDTDASSKRAESLETARSARWRFPIVLALPHPKRECWVLAGFDPDSEAEEDRLAEVRAEIGFDPRREAHRLTAEGGKGKRNAKNILERLVNADSGREERCWCEADLETLRARGEQSGLAAFLKETSERLVPVLAHRRS